MYGLKSFEPISGVPGQQGAKSLLRFELGSRKMEMIETITVRNLPKEFTGTYEASGVFNIVKNSFIPVNEGTTRYISESEFRFQGIMWLIAPFMKGTFKKQSLKYQEDFKKFAESTI